MPEELQPGAEETPAQPRPSPASRLPEQHLTLTEQLDQLGQYALRDLPRDLGDGLERHFPNTAAALPKERWRQIGWSLLGLAGVYWLVGLGPELAQPLVWLAGLGVGGYTGWHVLRHWRQARRDETAQRFAQHAAELASDTETVRIAALASLDQLAFDNPRYRLALVSLLTAWLQQRREAGVTGGHDSTVAVQMIAEFRALLLADDAEAEEDSLPGPSSAADPVAEPPALEILTAEAEPGMMTADTQPRTAVRE